MQQPDGDEVQSAPSGHSNEELDHDEHDNEYVHGGGGGGGRGDYHEYHDDELDDENYPKVSMNSRVSFQRPKQEKKINKQDFKKYKGLIKKRLSDKQRMPFDQLIQRNIHAGFEDELYEKKPMEKSKKILQLNRRLSHRPHPDEIQNDDELPKDLKIADSQYYQLYKYRSATEKDLVCLYRYSFVLWFTCFVCVLCFIRW